MIIGQWGLPLVFLGGCVMLCGIGLSDLANQMSVDRCGYVMVISTAVFGLGATVVAMGLKLYLFGAL